MQKNKAILATGIGVLSIGVFYWIYNQVNLAMKYCYKLRDFKINTLGINKTNITIFMSIRNFSNVGAIINKLDLDIFINDIWISKVLDSKTETVIKKNSASDIKFDVEFSLSDILKTNLLKATQIIYDLGNNKDKVIVHAKGVIGLRIGWFNFRNINIDVKMSVKEILTDDPNAFVCDIG